MRLAVLSLALGLNLEPHGGGISYETIQFKFDPDCSQNGDDTLLDYLENQMVKAKESGIEMFRLLDPATFKKLLLQELEAETEITRQHVDMKLRAKANEGKPKPATDNGEGVLRDLFTPDREDQILSAFHLLALYALSGNDVNDLLRAERSGSTEQVLEILQEHSAAPHSEIKDRLNKAKANSDHQFLAAPRSLEFLEGIKLVDNLFLGEGLIDLARILPCLDTDPAPDEMFDEDEDDEAADDDDEADDDKQQEEEETEYDDDFTYYYSEL